MPNKKELSNYEEEVKKRCDEAWRTKLKKSSKGDGTFTQATFMKKHGGKSQGAFSHFLTGKKAYPAAIIRAISEESGIDLTTLDPRFHDKDRFDSKANEKVRSQEGHLLYVLEQPDIDQPVAKIGITKDLHARIKSINNGSGVSHPWFLYRFIDLGPGVAYDVESKTKEELGRRYKRLQTEVFYCTGEIMVAVASTFVWKETLNPLWTVDSDDNYISWKLREEFNEIKDERREYLIAEEGLSGEEVETELDRPIDDEYWWN